MYRKLSIRAYVAFWLLFGVAFCGFILWNAVASRHKRALNAAEDQRLQEEALVDPGSIKVTTDLAGAQKLPVREISPTHFLIEISKEDSANWFMFRVQGAAGRTVRFDVRREKQRLSWSVLNPVYAYAAPDDLADPALFASTGSAGPAALKKAPNGSMLPPTDAQRWHFIEDAWFSDGTLSFVQKFDKSSAIVAMKYPLTPELNARFLKTASQSPYVNVVTIGRSKVGLPLQVVEIASATPPEARGSPCVVVMARELGNQQDAGWVAWGLINFLISDAPAAVDARSHFVFSVVPLADPGAAEIGRYDMEMETMLRSADDRPEPQLYARYFNSRRDSGHPIRLAISLRSTESAAPYHVECVSFPTDRYEPARRFHRVLTARMADAGIWVAPSPEQVAVAPMDLTSWLHSHHGATSLAYHINSQCSAKHLTLAQMQSLAQQFAPAALEYLHDEGTASSRPTDGFTPR